MPLPSREAFAAYARQVVESHDEWDSPHSFQTLHWDGEKLRAGTYACIMPDVHPAKYPALMMKLACEELEKERDDPAYAYLLQIESFGVTAPGPEASAAELAQYHADRVGRTFHQRPDAVEACSPLRTPPGMTAHGLPGPPQMAN